MKKGIAELTLTTSKNVKPIPKLKYSIGGSAFILDLALQDILSIIFSGLMLLMAVHMWRKSMPRSTEQLEPTGDAPRAGRRSWCSRSPDGRLAITARRTGQQTVA